METWSESCRKRARDDEYADITAGGTLGFTEHRSKRIQALPLRTSPKSKRWTDRQPDFPTAAQPFPSTVAPRVITPGDSGGEELAAQQQHTWADEPELISQTGDHDLDMVDIQQDEQQQHQHQLGPGSYQPDVSAPTIASRMPTPIHPNFPAQVRGNNWSGAAGGVLPHQEAHRTQGYGSNDIPVEYIQTGHMMGQDSVPRSLDGPAAAAQVMADWNMVQNRRLPSPISENGGEDNNMESPGMILDSLGQMGQTNLPATRHHLLSNLPPRSMSAIELRRLSRSPDRAHTPSAESPNVNAMDYEETVTPSPRKGHTRSKHTVASWTALQPGMVRSFSIGYRADCEKCRMKVPGHFNHIVVS